jgi:hypothetical protein
MKADRPSTSTLLILAVVTLVCSASSSLAQTDPTSRTSQADSAKAAAEGGDDTTELSSKATDPTASLMALNFQAIWNDFHGGAPTGESDDRWTLQFRPVIPFEALGHPNILRLTIPYQTGGRGEEGIKPISLFDLVIFNQHWGRWGIGPVMSFDTKGDSPDDFVIGPALGGVWQVNKKLNLGVFSQNVFWEDTALSQLQPVIAYQLGHGWSLSAGDLQYAYDWESEKWVSAPIGIQLGKVTKLGKLPVRLSVNPQYNLIDRAGLDKWSITFTFTALFPSL